MMFLPLLWTVLANAADTTSTDDTAATTTSASTSAPTSPAPPPATPAPPPATPAPPPATPAPPPATPAPLPTTPAPLPAPPAPLPATPAPLPATPAPLPAPPAPPTGSAPCVGSSVGEASTCNPILQRPPPVAATIVQTEVKCMTELGAEIGANSMHPAPLPILPRIRDTGIIPLRRKDWPQAGGPRGRALRITRPGKYRLEENLIFDWAETPANSDPPLQWGNVIGIAIESSNVELDLNGKTLGMTQRFASRQRFFFLIQMNNAVFPRGTAFYNEALVTPSNIVIKNGKFGRVTHMAIQGYENGNVILEDLQFENFEVAAISCVDCNHVTIRRCNIDNKDVDVQRTNFFGAFWSQARVLNRFVFELEEDNRQTGFLDHHLQLPTSQRIIKGEGDDLLAKRGLPQGSIFGIQLKVSFAGDASPSVVPGDVLIEQVTVKNLESGVFSRVGLSWRGRPLICATSDVLDFSFYFLPSGVPKIARGEIGSENSPEVTYFRACATTTFGFPKNLKKYIVDKSTVNIFSVAMEDGEFLKKHFGSDIRGHEANGAYGIRVRGMKNVIIRDVKVQNIVNGETGDSLKDRANLQMLEDGRFAKFPNLWQGERNVHFVFHLGNAYGVCFDKVTTGLMSGVKIDGVSSKVSQSFGVAVGRTSSTIWLDTVVVSDVKVLGQSVIGIPFLTPRAMNIYVEENTNGFFYRNVYPAHGWFSPTNPSATTDYSNSVPPAVGKCGEGEAPKINPGYRGDDDDGNLTNLIIIATASGALCCIAVMLFVLLRMAKKEKSKSANLSGSLKHGTLRNTSVGRSRSHSVSRSKSHKFSSLRSHSRHHSRSVSPNGSRREVTGHHSGKKTHARSQKMRKDQLKKSKKQSKSIGY